MIGPPDARDNNPTLWGRALLIWGSVALVANFLL